MKNPNKRILITGANGGIGKDTARQLALIEETERIYLACRNEAKAEAARRSLEETTGRSIFEVMTMDVSKPESVKAAVASLNEPIDALVMNAGGMGGKTPGQITKDGVTHIFASNVLGHVVLVNELLNTDKLKKVALYAGSEAARGIKKLGMNQPRLKTSSVDEFASIIDGSYFNGKMNTMKAYGLAKYMASLWMARQARNRTDIRFITMSPGGTKGTSIIDHIPGVPKIMLKHFLMPLVIPSMGIVHSLETGARRFVHGISNESLKSGVFYGSKKNVLTGPVVDQSTYFPDLKNPEFQENAHEAIHRFID